VADAAGVQRGKEELPLHVAMPREIDRSAEERVIVGRVARRGIRQNGPVTVGFGTAPNPAARQHPNQSSVLAVFVFHMA